MVYDLRPTCVYEPETKMESPTAEVGEQVDLLSITVLHCMC